MIIKIIPETDFEKARVQPVTHNNVGEFFIFGSKKDTEGDMVDFHDWSGSYMGLIGKTHYYELQLIEEQKNKKVSDALNRPASKNSPMIKRSGPKDGHIQGFIDAKEVKEMEEVIENNENNVKEFPPQPPQPEEVEETDKPTE